MNETTQLGSRNETTQLVSRTEATQLCTSVDRLQPPAPPLQQNRLFLPTLVTWEVERGKFYDTVRSLLKSKNQEINRLQLAVKLPWAIFFESVDILS
ncbi:hypothetical protein TNCV_3142101 [Trichonephila clavipes]|nr:hypothetical protein TNCV_3142101 [Trichonephila clavipes]